MWDEIGFFCSETWFTPPLTLSISCSSSCIFFSSFFSIMTWVLNCLLFLLQNYGIKLKMPRQNGKNVGQNGKKCTEDRCSTRITGTGTLGHFICSKNMFLRPIKSEELQVPQFVYCQTCYVGYHFQCQAVGLHLAGICNFLVLLAF